MKIHVLVAIFGIMNTVKSQDTLVWKCIDLSHVRIDKYFWRNEFIVLNTSNCKLDTLQFYGISRGSVFDDSKKHLFLPGEEMRCIINKTCWKYKVERGELSYFNFVDWDTNNCRKILGYNSKKSHKAIRKGKFLSRSRMFKRYCYNPSYGNYMLLNSELVEVTSIKIGI